MIKKFSIITLLIMVFISCSTLPDPNEETTTLTVGKIILDLKNIKNTNSVVKSNIIIRLKDQQTEKIIELRSTIGGLFYTLDLSEGKYSIESLSYRLPAEDYSIGIKFMNNNHTFSIQSPGVNNLGKIDWKVDGNKRPLFEIVANHSEVYDQFIEKYEDSLWLQETWNDINVF